MSNIKTGDILNFDYTGAVQSITLPKGTYKLECWGAQGGNGSSGSSSNTNAVGGLGGYSVGTITLSKIQKVYIYSGGKGQTKSNTGGYSTVNGGFNGGGSNYTYGSGGSGGGGSDIRIGTDSLYARVIVAGGGSGTGWTIKGAAGGGESGLSNYSSSCCGTQKNGGSTYTPGQNGTVTAGAFGIGGNGSGSSEGGSGGGGGWYGGGGAGYTGGAGGGSGYVYTSATASNYPSGCLLNSSYYLSAAKTIAGNTSFTSPTGSSETGHSGNGYCRITVIECKSTALYARINNSMKKATAFYFKLNNNKMYGISSVNYNGTVMNFNYTGSVQTATLTPGRYKLECWGAQGGNGCSSGSSISRTASFGGYSTGIINLNKSTTIYVYVGGAGTKYSTNASGGFNGGGACYSNNGRCMNSGGGGTDIRVKDDSLYARVIVAGGGGGCYETGTPTDYSCSGGGESGIVSNGSGSDRYGQPGTQTTGGAARTTTSWDSSYINSHLKGTFGIGGGSNGVSMSYINGGGGGWYGGGAGGPDGGAGGGSGYVYTSTTASNYPSGCLLNSTHYLSNAQTIAGNQSFPSPTDGTETGHSGNGYVRITKLTDIIYLTHANNDIMDFNYTGSTQSKTLKPGTYTIECWGGQGGTYGSYIGGYGGYSKGTITLTKATTIYISVGGAGSSSSTTAGFNGGGTGISSGRGGGGATDVRIGQNSLYARVIVAGGGGGAGVISANANPCGCGGGEYGGDGYYNNTTGSYTTGQNRCGGSASQTAGGITWSTGTQATFGQGGNASGYSCGGGGGGWYGGGGAYDSDSDSDGRWGGGGSGYVYTSSTAKNYPNGCLLNSTHYLINAQTIAGNTSFTSPTGSAETGHTGNGFCRITNLNPTQYGLYVKTNSGWKHIDL